MLLALSLSLSLSLSHSLISDALHILVPIPCVQVNVVSEFGTPSNIEDTLIDNVTITLGEQVRKMHVMEEKLTRISCTVHSKLEYACTLHEQNSLLACQPNDLVFVSLAFCVVVYT